MNLVLLRKFAFPSVTPPFVTVLTLGKFCIATDWFFLSFFAFSFYTLETTWLDVSYRNVPAHLALTLFPVESTTAFSNLLLLPISPCGGKCGPVVGSSAHFLPLSRRFYAFSNVLCFTRHLKVKLRRDFLSSVSSRFKANLKERLYSFSN